MAEKKELKVSFVKVGDIVADAEQPRKNFNPERLADLIGSIKKYGIINPLVLEDIGHGKYQLIDGERRFRSAKEIGLKEVPAIVRPAMRETDRLIEQFHIQEQHEGWTATEKAVAVSKLSEKLGIGVKALSQSLNLPESMIGEYVAFSQLLDKETFIKNETPVNFASVIVNLRKFVTNQSMEELEQEFTHKQQLAFEGAVVARIKRGDIRRKRDLAKLRDSFKSSPKSVAKFMKDSSLTVDKLFLQTDARSAFAYRNLMAACHAVTTYRNSGMKMGFGKLFSETDRRDMARAVAALEEIISTK